MSNKSRKYIFVTGGVVSGIGKGITAASLGRLLKARGMKVTMQKCDPYINVDPGMMSPYQHGEVFVTDDGTQADLDLGHYERFIDESLNKYSSVTAGKIYWSVLNRDLTGGYNGETVQVIPHITDEIKRTIYNVGVSNNSDIVITEIGGTVGDIEGLPFIEAIRQVSNEVGRDNCLFIHVTLVPFIGASGELKSKPTQHSVKELLSLGIQPDIIVCRSERELSQGLREKLALFCNVQPECIIENLDAGGLYEVPLMLEEKGLSHVVCKRLCVECKVPDLTEWQTLVAKRHKLEKRVRIALVGKYVSLHDAYLSVVESLEHAGGDLGVKIDIDWLDSSKLKASDLQGTDGIIVPGGSGKGAAEGAILAAKYARESGIPYLGICLGMQMAIVERLGTQECLIEREEQKCGSHECKITEGTKVYELYSSNSIDERYVSKYAFDTHHRDVLESSGLRVVGTADNSSVEIVEATDHPWFIGVQFHPEFKSRPNRPHPLFVGFVRAMNK